MVFTENVSNWRLAPRCVSGFLVLNLMSRVCTCNQEEHRTTLDVHLQASLEHVVVDDDVKLKVVAGGLGKMAGLMCKYHPGDLISVHARQRKIVRDSVSKCVRDRAWPDYHHPCFGIYAQNIREGCQGSFWLLVFEQNLSDRKAWTRSVIVLVMVLGLSTTVTSLLNRFCM